MRGVWHHQDRRRRGPRELTGIVDHWREGSSLGPREWTWCRAGLAPCTRTGWPSEEKTSVRGCESRCSILFLDSKNAIAWPAPRTQPACAAPVTSSHSLATPPVRCAVASSKTRPVTAGAQVIPSTTSGFSCAPGVIGSRSVNKNDSVRPSRQMTRISVSKSPTTAPSTCATSSTKPHPPMADAWPHTS